MSVFRKSVHIYYWNCILEHCGFVVHMWTQAFACKIAGQKCIHSAPAGQTAHRMPRMLFRVHMLCTVLKPTTHIHTHPLNRLLNTTAPRTKRRIKPHTRFSSCSRAFIQKDTSHTHLYYAVLVLWPTWVARHGYNAAHVTLYATYILYKPTPHMTIEPAIWNVRKAQRCTSRGRHTESKCIEHAHTHTHNIIFIYRTRAQAGTKSASLYGER